MIVGTLGVAEELSTVIKATIGLPLAPPLHLMMDKISSSTHQVPSLRIALDKQKIK